MPVRKSLDIWWYNWAAVFVSDWRHRFTPWLGNIPWRRKWQPPPVFSPEKSHGQRSISSVQLSRSVVSNSLQPHESQNARPPCPSPTPGVYPNLCPLSQWCHPVISSSVDPSSSYLPTTGDCRLQSLPPSGSFPMSQLFAWGGQSTGVSASASVLPMNTQDWSPLGWTDWISLQSKGLSRVFSNTTV